MKLLFAYLNNKGGKQTKVKVMKFGGTSLKSMITRDYVYNHIKRNAYEYKIVLVVSAMGRYPDGYATDTLLSNASELMSKEEKAWLASIGEQYSTLKICAELLEKGYKVRAIPYQEAGIISDHKYEYANVLSLDNSKIMNALNQVDIVVVSGFIACNKSYKVTTLGRGGSDFSAVLFANMLQLDQVEIYSDVDGVYEEDPNINNNAKKFTCLSYDEMLNLNSKVLHDRCVSYAKQHKIRIHLLGTFSENEGTYIE